MASPYEVLGIDPSADSGTIERAYRDKVKETHPDQGGSVAEFTTVVAAYESLTGTEGEHDRTKWRPSTGERDEHEWETTEVEYLNYDRLVDHDWEWSMADLFERAAAEDITAPDFGQVSVDRSQSLLQSVEECGMTWPYACRGGACANCAVAVKSGELAMPADHILPAELLAEGIRLSCVGTPCTDTLQVVYNIKHRPDLDDLRLPPDRFTRDRMAD